MIVTLQSKAMILVPQFFIVLVVAGCVCMYDPFAQHPDLIIEFLDSDLQEDGDLEFILRVKNQGGAWAHQTEVTVLEPKYHGRNKRLPVPILNWASKRRLVPALSPKEGRIVLFSLKKSFEAYIYQPTFLFKVDPYERIDELSEGNNELRIPFPVNAFLEEQLFSPSLPEELPEFPWPPPRASAMANLPNEFFHIPEAEIVRLQNVDKRLSDALDFAGYVEKSYYAVPDGFAIVARLEQINPDGTPKSGSARWSIEVKPLRKFSLSAYLRALFTSEPGYFRIIVFIITPHPFSQSDVQVSIDDAIEWLSDGGLNRLPSSVGEKPYSDEYACTALIYEFEKQRGEETADTVIPGRLSPQTHLEKLALMNGLRRQ